MFFVAAFALGAVVGSFLNVCIIRVPKEESVIFPASHCVDCRAPIAWHDNIPIASYFWLRGRCRSCGAKISKQYVVVEFLTACLFVLFYNYFGISVAGAVWLLFSLALLVQSAIDFRHQIIPDGITLPGILLGTFLSVLIPGLHGQTSWLIGLREAAIGVLLGGGFLYAAGTIAEWILKKEAMGGGDVKLLAMIGAFVGWQGVLWTVLVSSVLGSIVGVYLRFKKGEQMIPFGPYLGLAAFLYIFFGEKTIRAYLNFIGWGI